MYKVIYLLLGTCSLVLGQMPMPMPLPIPVANTATCSKAVAAAAATARTDSATSNVAGKAFNRIMQVYHETTSFGNVTNDRKQTPLSIVIEDQD